MAIVDYPTLQSAIGDWLNRSDLVARIPDFITLAEADLNRSLRVRSMIVRATASISAQFTPLPADFLKMEILQLDSSTPFPQELVFKTPEQMRLERRRLYNLPGQPEIYSTLGKLLEVAPSPDLTYTADMAYYQKIPPLSNGVNWLICEDPDLYLYGSLMHSAPYLKDDDRVQIWTAGYDRLLARIQQADEDAKFSGSTPRVSFRKLG